MIARILLLVGLSLATCAAARSAEPVLHVEDLALLRQLEARGYGFASLFAIEARGLAEIHAGAPAYRAIVDTIAADVADIRRDYATAGRPLAEVTATETGRVMDMRWLTSTASEMRLVGVVNRLDRRDFHAVRGEGGCGEVRLVYRLAYSFRKDGKGKVLSSRMPFNFNAVFDVEPDADGGCVGVAGRWTPAIDESADLGWLIGGPLERSQLRFRQLELNAQVVRFPSGQEPEFGGQAVYLMRIFDIDSERISELPLENTPDAPRLTADAALKARLAAYVAENADAIDGGVYRIPDEFLARKVISVSTFGGARQANHPFQPLFQPSDFAALDFSAGRLVRSPEALLERLDNGTCQGCHQSSGTAGFHLIGLDDAFTSPLNRIEVGISPHLHAELPRRAAYVKAVVAEREPDRFRPLSFAPPAIWGEDGSFAYERADAAMPCIAEEDAGHFAEVWTCGGTAACTVLATSDGAPHAQAQCLPPPDARDFHSGQPCLAGPVSTAGDMPFNDRYRLKQFAAFAEKASPRDYTCRPPRIGVPGGMAYRQCDERDRAFATFRAGGDLPREICGLTGGRKFDLCVATGNFDQCLAGAVQRGNRTSCSADHFCRDDYICQAFPADTPNVDRVKGVGFCSPTYFLFQMRIDNHTTPWPRPKGRGVEAEAAYRSVEVEGDPDDLW